MTTFNFRGLPDCFVRMIRFFVLTELQKVPPDSLSSYHFIICLKLESFQRFFKPSVLFQHDRAGQARSRWLRELTVATKEEGRLEEERRRREMEAREMLNMKLAREQEEKRMQDPEVVAFLRGGAQAATMWCHRTPLTK